MSHRDTESYAASAMQYLNALCDQLDRNEPVRMPAFKWLAHTTAPVALGLCVAACNNSGTANSPSDKRAGMAEICDNGIDDDKNGAVDCDDTACRDLPVCMAVVLYAAPSLGNEENDSPENVKPPPSDSSSGAATPDNPATRRNDSESQVDCGNPQYARHPQCGVMYAGPPQPSPAPSPTSDKEGKTRPPFDSNPAYPAPPVALYAAPPNLSPGAQSR